MLIKIVRGLIEVTIENKKKKVRCPVYNKFTSSVHDKLKPIRSVYLDSCGSKVDLIICKKRYHCYNCNKIFTKKLNINVDKGNISNKVKIQIRKDLTSYSLSVTYIAKENFLSLETIRNILDQAMSNYQRHIINWPIVLAFDEFKTDKNYGKYSYVLNNLIQRRSPDILTM